MNQYFFHHGFPTKWTSLCGIDKSTHKETLIVWHPERWLDDDLIPSSQRCPECVKIFNSERKENNEAIIKEEQKEEN